MTHLRVSSEWVDSSPTMSWGGGGGAPPRERKGDIIQLKLLDVFSLQLERCALRIILWDARKSKKPFFRGEVSRSVASNRTLTSTVATSKGFLPLL